MAAIDLIEVESALQHMPFCMTGKSGSRSGWVSSTNSGTRRGRCGATGRPGGTGSTNGTPALYGGHFVHDPVE